MLSVVDSLSRTTAKHIENMHNHFRTILANIAVSAGFVKARDEFKYRLSPRSRMITRFESSAQRAPKKRAFGLTVSLPMGLK
jgi:hypothetical protein